MFGSLVANRSVFTDILIVFIRLCIPYNLYYDVRPSEGCTRSTDSVSPCVHYAPMCYLIPSMCCSIDLLDEAGT